MSSSMEAGEDVLAQVQCFIDDGHTADEGGIERLRDLLERASATSVGAECQPLTPYRTACSCVQVQSMWVLSANL